MIKWSALVLGLTVLAACSGESGPIEQGPSDDPDFPICVDVDNNDQSAAAGFPASATVGFPALVNTGEQTAVIDSVNLIEPLDLSMIESWIVIYPDWPEGQSAANFGIIPGYILAVDREWWLSTMDAVPAAGAEVRSTNVTDDAFVLVLGLRIDEGADLATADAVEVEYSVDGSEYVYRINRSIELGLDGHYPEMLGHC